jgi:hypothetical protein
MVVVIMKFESKAHMAQELIAGRRFRNNDNAEIFYSENRSQPFRVDNINWEDSVPMSSFWSCFDQDVWTEVKPRHVHQDLIDSYVVGQAWQAYNKVTGEWYDLRNSNTWLRPAWDANTQYRLHPHNDVIQAYKSGADIQSLNKDIDEWVTCTTYWGLNTEYRIKPTTKILYEWFVKTTDGWFIADYLMTEEEVANKPYALEYKKTGRSFEVEV